MKKFLFIICISLLVGVSNAQVQVWTNPESYQIREIVSANNKIFYISHQQNLFCTTGNENSAIKLGDFFEVNHLTVFGDKVVFFAITGETSAIWISDGTQAGTFEISKEFAGSNISIFKNKIYFTSSNSIYSCDGTPGGVTKVLTVPPRDQPYPSVILSITALDDKLIYYYYGQLGVTDGVSSTIKFLSDNATSKLITGAYVTTAVVNNKLFFQIIQRL